MRGTALLVLVACLGLPAVPAGAIAPGGYAVELTADGASRVVPAPGGDTTHACGGLAPLVNHCAFVTGPLCHVALSFPPLEPTPVGSAPEMSILIDIRGDNGMRAMWDISLIQPVVVGGGVPLPPFVMQTFTFHSVGNGQATQLAWDVHVGLWDPHAAPFVGSSLPSANSVEAGVGEWQLEVGC